MSKSDVMAGRAYVSLYTKNDRLTSGLRSAQQQIQKFGADMLSLGTKMVAMTAALATPIAFATKTFSDFDDAMRAVKAVSQATESQFASMTERAKELGRTTSFTAIQVAQLMTELGRAGFAPEQVNVMTEAVMNLARASGTEAVIASGIMAATIRQFGLAAGDAARVSDVLTVAANATFNSVESLGEALSYAGPVAKELGMSLEDTVAILGTLGNVGIQGSEAGTALRRLSVISAATGEDLKRIFDISNVDAAGQLKPIVQIMDEIGKKIENLPMAEKVAKMNEAFGLLGITSSSVLSHAAVETTALADKLRNAEGAAASAAKEMDAGLGGAFRIIMSAVEGLQLAIGGALSDSIKGVTESITVLIGKASAWIDNNKDMTIAIAATVAGLGAASVAILGIGLAAKIAGIGIGVAVTAITVIKTASKLAIGAFNLFVAATTGVAFVLQGIFATSLLATTAGLGTFTTAGGVMATAWTSIAGVMSAAWAVIMGPVTPFVIAGAAIVAIMTAIGAAAAWSAIKGTDFSAAWGVAKNTLVELLATAKQVGGILMDALAGGDYDIAFRAVIAGLKVALADSLDAMSNLWGMFWRGSFGMAKRFAMSLLGMMGDVMKAIAKSIIDPTRSGRMIGEAIAKLAKGELKLSLGIDTEKMRADAKAELAKLEAELASRKKQREAGAANAGGDVVPPSKEEKALQDQLAELKAAQQPEEEMWTEADALQARLEKEIRDLKAGKAESGTDFTTGGAGGAIKSTSVASFNLAELAGSVGRGTAERQLTVAQQQKQLQEKMLELAEKQLLAMMNGGMVFP